MGSLLFGQVLVEDRLDGFKIDITEFVMPEVFEEEGHFTKLVVFKAVANIFDAVVQSTEDPLVNEGKSIIVEGGKIIDEVLGNLGRHLGTELGQTELEGIPDLVQEKSVTDNSSDIHIHVSGYRANYKNWIRNGSK